MGGCPVLVSLEDKVVAITGAGSGIGRASAVACAKNGARVVALDVSEARVRETVKAISDCRYAGRYLVADVTSDIDWVSVISSIESIEGRLDVLVNNAGGNLLKSLTDTTVEEWGAVMDLNLKSVFLGMRLAIPLMLGAGGGAVINISSALGLKAFPKMAAYCASKAAVIALTRQAALDYADRGIRVNCVCPGPTLTARVRGYVESTPGLRDAMLARAPLGRFGEPEEIARAIVFLADPDSSYVTGAVLSIDGGQSVS